MLIIKCQPCGAKFSANKKQQSFIEDSTTKGMSMVMLTCKVCKDSFPFHLSGTQAKIEDIESIDFRCPTKACAGHVSKIDDITEYEYGCGECGTTWSTRSDLLNNIKESLKKFPHRKAVYKLKNGALTPTPPSEQPEDYEDNVRKEWDEK
jgi:hypothetical protein